MDTSGKKQLKYEVNLLALALIVYTLVTYAVVTGDLLLRVLLSRVMPGDFSDRLLSMAGTDGWSEIVASVLGIAVVFLLSRSRTRFSDIFRTKQHMSFTVFIEVLCVFSAFQLVAVWLDDLMEYCLNMIGFTLSESIAQATASSENAGSFLYACVMAPVGEELVYRGFCLRRMQERGTVFAIVLSAVLFGVMHANLAQMLFAFGVGLVLGFVAVEYSVFYAIALHVINNFLFGDLLSFAYRSAPDELFSLVFDFLFGVLFFGGAIVVLTRRKQIADYIRAHKPEKGAFRCAFTAVLFVVFFVMCLALSLFLITPLKA